LKDLHLRDVLQLWVVGLQIQMYFWEYNFSR